MPARCDQRHEWPPWHAKLSEYRTPSTRTASLQILTTVVPYFALWLGLIAMLRHGNSPVVVPIQVLASLFLVRVFVLFHDCVHGSLFPDSTANTFFGHALGLLTFTPFDDWRFSHLRHHATYADLDARGFGDIWTLTRDEYAASPRGVQLCYRFYRNPVVMLGLGALFTFLLRFRLPTRTTKRKERMSVLFTNLFVAGIILLLGSAIGWTTYLRIQLPILWMAGAGGIWLFFVQHQFEGVYWARRKDWDALRAAMEGSSCYALPAVLRWFSANIDYHHVHHLNARIPNYRLRSCLNAIPALQAKPPLSLRESLAATRLKLWDERHGRLVGFDA